MQETPISSDLRALLSCLHSSDSQSLSRVPILILFYTWTHPGPHSHSPLLSFYSKMYGQGTGQHEPMSCPFLHVPVHGHTPTCRRDPPEFHPQAQICPSTYWCHTLVRRRDISNCRPHYPDHCHLSAGQHGPPPASDDLDASDHTSMTPQLTSLWATLQATVTTCLSSVSASLLGGPPS